MSFNSSQMIHQLRTDFERLLEMVTGPEAHLATIGEMERYLFRQVLRLGLKLLQLFVAARVEGESHASLEREDGSVLPYHSQKRRSYFSIFGKMTFERAYFYAPGVGGECPLDEALSLPERCYSDLLMECATLLGVEEAYDKGLRVLARLLGLDLSELALETAVREQSQEVEAYYEQKEPFPTAEEGPILVAQADGKGVPMVRQGEAEKKARRGKGEKKVRKKEAITCAVYTIQPYPRTPREVVDALFRRGDPPPKRPPPSHKQVFATLKGKEEALRRLAEWTARRDGAHIQERVALTDGSIPLQKQVLSHLHGFTLVLDIIHVAEYLWEAGTALYGETDPQRAQWVEEQLLDILSGRVEQVIQRLEEKAATLAPTSLATKTLHRVATYFQRNRPYMDYADYLQRGWPIGTGVVEGACRHLVKDRMEQAGMRWTLPGAEALLALRAVNENGDWDDFHAFRRAQRHQRLYGSALHTEWINYAERLEINPF